MRHGKRVKKLSRTASHRQAVLANLASAIIDRERIQTTDSLAKESRKLVERLITKAKTGTLHARRQVLKIIQNRRIVAKLFDTIAPRYAERNGGYVRLIRVGNRLGDGAALSIVELIGSELAVEEPKKARKKKRKKAPEEAEETFGAPPQASEAQDEESRVDEIEVQTREEESKESSSPEEGDEKEKLRKESSPKNADTSSESRAAEKGKEGEGEEPDK